MGDLTTGFPTRVNSQRRIMEHMIFRPILLVVLLSINAHPAMARGGRESADGSTIESSDIAGVTNEEIDYLGIAALMIRDGNFTRAASALSNIDPDLPATDLSRFYTLSGLVDYQAADFASAAESFELSIQNGQDDQLVFAYLAQAYFTLGEYQKALRTIEELTDFDRFPDLLGTKSQAHWYLGQITDAFETLVEAISRYPDEPRFYQQRIFYLIELDLTREAAEQSATYFRLAGEDPDGYLTIGEALIRGAQYEQAIVTLEMGKLIFPDNEPIRLSLARAYLESGSTLTAAKIVEEASHYNPAYNHDAAELFRRAGYFGRSLYLNTLVTDPRDRATQRFNLLIEMERYEAALSLEARLQSLELVEDDALRYALAYVHYQVGRFVSSIEYLNQIVGSEYDRQIIQLKEAIENSKNREIQYF